MDADAERLLMAFMEGTLDESGAARLLERLDADPEFLDSAVRHWRMDRLLESGGGSADEAAEALRRSVRIQLEGSGAESAALSQQVASRLRALRASGAPRRTGVRRSRGTGVHPVAWALGGALAATLVIAVVLSVSSENRNVPSIRPAAPRQAAAVPPVEPKKPVPSAEAPPVTAPPPGAPVPATSKERRVRMPVPKPAPKAPVPVSPRKETAPRRTVPVAPVRMATVTEANGAEFILAGGRRQPAKGGMPVNSGSGLDVAPGGSAVVRYPDGTILHLAPATTVQAFSTAPGGGKGVDLARGSLRATVTAQPDGKPMILSTPRAEARVLGTEFTLSIDGDSTRLDVVEGRVRLTRRRDRSSVDVAAGHYAVAHPTRRLVVRARVAGPIDPLILEVEAFRAGGAVTPADGQRGRLFLEPMAGASQGTCVSAPGVGASVSGPLTLQGGTSYLWVRWRDDLFDQNGETVSFDVLANGKRVERIAGGGADKNWKWSVVKFQGKGKIQLTLRSAYKGEVQTAANQNTRQSPYASVVRWDRIILTRDESFVPSNK